AAPTSLLPDHDILHSRVRTASITGATFKVRSVNSRTSFDVGGQRPERKKCIHCFENVTALLFLVSLRCCTRRECGMCPLPPELLFRPHGLS
ncbi:G-protein alpha subunit-domain-containing protein, partial [Mycena maculata]